MRDPVSALDGHSYERENIERWLREHITSPMTGARLESRLLLPNHALRNSIKEYSHQQGGSATPRPKESSQVQDGHYYVDGIDIPENASPRPCAAAFASSDPQNLDDLSDVFSMSSGVSDEAWEAYLSKEWRALPAPSDSPREDGLPPAGLSSSSLSSGSSLSSVPSITRTSPRTSSRTGGGGGGCM